MEVDFEDGIVQSQLTYIIPIICEDDECTIDFLGIGIEGGSLGEEPDVHLIPGDTLKFVFGDVEVDLNELSPSDSGSDAASTDLIRKRAGDFAIVIVVNKDLVADGTSCVQIEKNKPGSIQIDPELKDFDLQLLDLVLYCDSCGCSRTSSWDSWHEKPEVIRFHVGPRPRQVLSAHALEALKRKGKAPTPNPTDQDGGEKKGDDE